MKLFCKFMIHFLKARIGNLFCVVLGFPDLNLKQVI
jgi:hypothetical protein